MILTERSGVQAVTRLVCRASPKNKLIPHPIYIHIQQKQHHFIKNASTVRFTQFLRCKIFFTVLSNFSYTL